MLKRGARVDDPASPGSAIFCAARSLNPAVVRLMMNAGAKYGDQALALLHRAVPNEESRAAMIETIQKATGTDSASTSSGTKGSLSAADIEQIARAVQGVSAPRKVEATVELAVFVPKFIQPPSTDDYAVIVGIENYADVPAAKYAERDAAAVKSFVQAMGVPDRNIMTLTGTRATRTGLVKAFEAWLPNNVSENSRVIVFYSGHGAPDAKTKQAYLVPSDGDPQYLAETGYPLDRLYEKLGKLKAKQVLVALDSCFSGAGGRSVLAKGTRPLVGKMDLAPNAGSKVAVLSASGGDQISGSNEDAGYGTFTYNLLTGLNGAAKNAQGQVTLQSLYDYVKPKVQDEARRANREQTPQLQSASPDSFILRAK
ncbi:MAG: caspase family protein [Elusimicrobiota bacterium]|nr:MAG: caspase family protein [Elusimicrobiota bacterium]